MGFSPRHEKPPLSAQNRGGLAEDSQLCVHSHAQFSGSDSIYIPRSVDESGAIIKPTLAPACLLSRHGYGSLRIFGGHQIGHCCKLLTQNEKVGLGESGKMKGTKNILLSRPNSIFGNYAGIFRGFRGRVKIYFCGAVSGENAGEKLFRQDARENEPFACRDALKR